MGDGARPARAATRCSPRREVDWVAKLRLLEGYRDRDGLDWDDHRLAAIDIQWSDVRPEKGLVHRLVATGPARACSSTRPTSSAAVDEPPEDTRAWFRGECLRRYADEIVGGVAGTRWSSTCRASAPCSGCRCWSRCGAPRPTSATCCDRAPDAAVAAARRWPATATPARPAAVRRARRRAGAAVRRRQVRRLGSDAVHLRRSPWLVRSTSRPQRRDDGSRTTPPSPPPAARPQGGPSSDIDSVLDEIDDVLESNAEEFVRGFVQKGGQ